MKIRIDKKYLRIPINNNMTEKKILLSYQEGKSKKIVAEFDCRLDAISPHQYAYADVSRFVGHTLEYECVPPINFVPEQCDGKQLDQLFEEPYRPLIHYTPEMGWINDPNGLIKYGEQYHLFYQYNPCGTVWGNMHWGHAISADLIHWKEQDIALFPDEMGTMFSGCAIEDANNVSGLRHGQKSPFMLFYTAAGNTGKMSEKQSFTQCMAVSFDGGKTFEKYRENPIVETLVPRNRDPKVVYVEELEKYIMALYLPDGVYGLLQSEDLLSWELIQKFEIDGDRECPDIQLHCVEGERYWVIMGASDKYVVGKFQNGTFDRLSNPKQLSCSGFSYAGQSFSGLDDGRVIRITWEKPNMPCQRAPYQMSIPMELKLQKEDNELYLTTAPAKELQLLYAESREWLDLEVGEPLRIPLEPAAYDISISVSVKNDSSITIFGHTLHVNAEEHCVSNGRIKLPFRKECSVLDIRIIVDRCTFEVFVDSGRAFAVLPCICDDNLPYLKLTAEQTIKKLAVHRLHSIHSKK